MSVKQEQQIYQELCGLVANALNANGWRNWAKNVLQYGQWTLQEVPSPSVMIDYNDGAKYGWESTKYKWDKANQDGKAEVSYYRQIYVDFLFFRNPKNMLFESPMSEYDGNESNFGVDVDGNLKISDRDIWLGSKNHSGGMNAETQPDGKKYASDFLVSPIDVAQYLRTWFLSDFGIDALRKLGYGIIDSSEMENPNIETDDAIYARTPRFTITLVMKEITLVDVDFIKDYNIELKIIP